MTLRQQLVRSVAEECGFPRVAPPVSIDERYWALHRKCATGTITAAEMDELDAMCAAKEREYESTTGGAGVANNAPASV